MTMVRVPSEGWSRRQREMGVANNDSDTRIKEDVETNDMGEIDSPIS